MDSSAPFHTEWHNIPDNHNVVAVPILGGLHLKYRLEKIAVWKIRRISFFADHSLRV
jgi:hypothetical protein